MEGGGEGEEGGRGEGPGVPHGEDQVGRRVAHALHCNERPLSGKIKSEMGI